MLLLYNCLANKQVKKIMRIQIQHKAGPDQTFGKIVDFFCYAVVKRYWLIMIKFQGMKRGNAASHCIRQHKIPPWRMKRDRLFWVVQD